MFFFIWFGSGAFNIIHFFPLNTIQNIQKHQKPENCLKVVKLRFPDLRIADSESSGPQLFKNQLFEFFKESESEVQNDEKWPPGQKQRKTTIWVTWKILVDPLFSYLKLFQLLKSASV